MLSAKDQKEAQETARRAKEEEKLRKALKEGERIVYYGRAPAKQVAVVLSPNLDPKEMMKGMEEYFFKQTQAMEFSQKASIAENIYKAVLMKESMNFSIFQHNLEKKIDDIVSKTGIKPTERVNTELEEA